MTKIINSYYNLPPVAVDLDALTKVVWSGWTGEFFFNTNESNGVIASDPWDSADKRLYKAVERMVKSWEAVDDDEIGGTIYTRPESVKLP